VEYDSQTACSIWRMREGPSPPTYVRGVYVENPNSSSLRKQLKGKIRAATKGILIVGVNPIAQLSCASRRVRADIVIGRASRSHADELCGHCGIFA